MRRFLRFFLSLGLWVLLSMGILGQGCFVGVIVDCHNDGDCALDEFCRFDGVCVLVNLCPVGGHGCFEEFETFPMGVQEQTPPQEVAPQEAAPQE